MAVPDFDEMAEYRRMVGKCPRLTRTEEIAAVKQGDYDLLVRSQMPWVIQIAHKAAIQFRWRDVGSLISAGMLALVQAVRTFDPQKGCRLTTYVYRPVWWACHSEMRKSLGGCAPKQAHGKYRPTKLWGDQPPPVACEEDFQQAVDDSALVEQILDLLTDREREVMQRISQGEMQTEIAERYGVSRQRVLQIKLQAVAKARAKFRSEKSLAQC